MFVRPSFIGPAKKNQGQAGAEAEEMATAAALMWLESHLKSQVWVKESTKDKLNLHEKDIFW